MLNMAEIDKEIESLEKCNDTNYTVCKKLAILYIVRDHYNKRAATQVKEPIAEPAKATSINKGL